MPYPSSSPIHLPLDSEFILSEENHGVGVSSSRPAGGEHVEVQRAARGSGCVARAVGTGTAAGRQLGRRARAAAARPRAGSGGVARAPRGWRAAAAATHGRDQQASKESSSAVSKQRVSGAATGGGTRSSSGQRREQLRAAARRRSVASATASRTRAWRQPVDFRDKEMDWG